MKAKIHVTLKQGILDPQGKAVEHALATLGYTAVANVRVGKYIELEVDESAAADVGAQVKAMCEKLLANTIIEDYSYELESDRLKPLPQASAAPVVEIASGGPGAREGNQKTGRAGGDRPDEGMQAATSLSLGFPEQGARVWATASAKPIEDSQAHDEARRLARRIMSDLALLNQSIIDEGIRNGTLRDLLKDDLEEGLPLYRQQVPESVRAQKDYYGEAFEVFISERKAGLGLT